MKDNYKFDQVNAMRVADDNVLASSAKLMQRNAYVYEELAKYRAEKMTIFNHRVDIR